VAAIGTAAGAGLFVVAITGTVLILVILSLLDQVEEITRRRFRVEPSPHPPPPDEPDEGSSEDLP
jgi:uncharacterized membrane protein YhiD involved in acid resistance